MYRCIKNPPYEKQPAKLAHFFAFLGGNRRKRGEREARGWVRKNNACTHTIVQAVFRAFSLARDSRFALATLSPLFAENAQNITPVLQARKTWRPYILPQYHVSLTQSIKYKESHIVAIFVLVLTWKDMMYARFEDMRPFLYVFMSVVRVFVLQELFWKMFSFILFIGRHLVPYGGLRKQFHKMSNVIFFLKVRA